jgi:SAM-dependent methyltransferase
MKAAEDEPLAGSDDTRSFYDREGWTEQDGVLTDRILFGATEDGPVRRAMHERRMQRVVAQLSRARPPLNLLECGCGGNPEPVLLPLCRKYTGIDFSETGIQVSRRVLNEQSVPFELVVGDICSLPFADASFDAVYSAHAIYHIPGERAQAKAFGEAMRVLRRGGIAVFVLANPRPLLFPVRLLRRLAAETPGLGALLNRIRPQPPLPYRPMSLNWTRRLLEPHGTVTIELHSMGSGWFARNVSERTPLGSIAWKTFEVAERRFPRALVALGNYVQIVVEKR